MHKVYIDKLCIHIHVKQTDRYDWNKCIITAGTLTHWCSLNALPHIRAAFTTGSNQTERIEDQSSLRDTFAEEINTSIEH